jgi:hypothetical protein
MSLILPNPFLEGLDWRVLTSVEKRHADIDWYRARYPKAEAEARYFAENEPYEVVTSRGNLLMYLGASCIWGCLTGAGTGTAGSPLTYFNNANTYVYVGDGNGAAPGGGGTVSVTNGGTSVTFSASQSNLLNNYLSVAADSSAQVYRITAGSGTSWTITPAYGGTTNAAGVPTIFTGELPNQTDLQASAGATHQAVQQADSPFPSYVDGNTPFAISAATNATPIVITTPTHAWGTGDFIHIQGVLGNTGANGLWQITVLSGTTFSLNGSVGNGAYTSSTGYATKNNVLVTQATFANAAANFSWYEWVIRNNATNAAGRPLNRKVVFLGQKTSAASWTFKTAISVA